MFTAQGEKLRTLVSETLNREDIVRERFLLKDLHKYVSSESNRDVLCLYGLRRTGKTIMIMQEISNLDDYDNILFIRCDEDDTLGKMRETLDDALAANPECRKIFIDEATKPQWLVNQGSFLADEYSARGIRVVLTGTDSLCFVIASNSELYDRATFLHTTYISFKEYNYLLNRSLDDYIRYGGTLTESGKRNAFHSPESTEQYTNTAIVDNILHTLQRWNNGDNIGYDVLCDFIDNDLLASAINKVLEYHNHSLTDTQINKKFKPHDWGSVKQMMSDDTNDTESIKQLLQDALNIKDHRGIKIDDQTVECLVKYLKWLDVLYPIPKVKNLDSGNKQKYLVTQVGMRYSQATQQVKALSDLYDAAYMDKLDSDIRGRILEDIVLCQLLRENENNEELSNSRDISRYRSDERQGTEIDIVVSDNKAKSVLLIEVKHSDQIADAQRKNLNRTDVCLDIENKTGNTIFNKAVVYRGANTETEDGVLYINASAFLVRSQEILNELLTHCDVRTFAQLAGLMPTNVFGNGDVKQKITLPEPEKTEKPKEKTKFDRTDD